ncbi:MAG: phosphoribosylanthranilate isomerase [Chromatiales bacterium]|nr:phosphoribosylanthranilate isomerase [Chromatiales bacterium]
MSVVAAARRRTRVKICGITRPVDAEAAVEAGADAIGLVFHPSSPRNVDADTAARIARAVPAFVTVVGLVVDAEERRIRSLLDATGVELLQFHGDESAEACRPYGRRYLKAIRMRPGVDLAAAARAYHDAAALLLDAYVPGVPGGTGSVFDWSRARLDPGPPVVLAGGLTPENVADAIRIVRPWAVDVSGGVESAPGIKDAEKIRRFIAGVRDADDD